MHGGMPGSALRAVILVAYGGGRHGNPGLVVMAEPAIELVADRVRIVEVARYQRGRDMAGEAFDDTADLLHAGLEVMGWHEAEIGLVGKGLRGHVRRPCDAAETAAAGPPICIRTGHRAANVSGIRTASGERSGRRSAKSGVAFTAPGRLPSTEPGKAAAVGIDQVDGAGCRDSSAASRRASVTLMQLASSRACCFEFQIFAIV